MHCYKTEYREKIKDVMRFSGPRMIIYEPRLALKHLIESLRHK
ncbi:nitrous oxide-stimulated promoter family protein [Clostridium sp. YIM B02515]|uniref:Nitrous oxide-stimulated promoter family protein n=1 Tax=Clostridium rhizosphaerae TaxID=2803861 RepID=A0ABS1TGY3_9CLOT|nr:nitrous oxide-stimulated promoter family protein [Clostridium rhizosphaerae]